MSKATALQFIIGLVILAWAQAGPAQTEKAGLLGRLAGPMVAVPAGCFRMGDLNGDGHADERPVREVCVKAFRLGKYEVTFDQYDAFATTTGRPLPKDAGFGRGSRPVVNVKWQDVQAFIRWINEQTGGRLRLPSEAEWEYAARAGSTTRYWWGDDYDPDMANGSAVAGEDRWDSTAPVGQFPANGFGLHDVTGNVAEWTEDCLTSESIQGYRGAPTDGRPWGPTENCGSRIIRGGSWTGSPALLRVSNRDWGATVEVSNAAVGFRLAADE